MMSLHHEYKFSIILPLLELDLILNDAIIPTFSLLLHSVIINCARKEKLRQTGKQGPRSTKTINSRNKPGSKTSSKKMLHVDDWVDKAKPVAP